MDWLDLLAVQGTLKSLLQHHSSKASILWCSTVLHPYTTTRKTIALTRQIFVSKLMSRLFNMLSRLDITFLQRSKYFLISWLQSPSAVILEPPKIKPYHDTMILVFWMLNFKPTSSLSSFTSIKRLFSSSSLSAIRVVSSAYLRLLIFLLAILIPACASSNPPFLMMYSAYGVGRFLGEGNGYHPSILAQKIPRTKEPGGLQSTGLQRVRQDWVKKITLSEKSHFHLVAKLCLTLCNPVDCSPGFPGDTSGKEPTCQCRRHKRYGFDFWVRKILWRRIQQSIPAFLPEVSHGQRSLSAMVHRVAKNQTQLKWLSMHAGTVAHQAPCLCDFPGKKKTGVGCHFLL